MSFNPGGPDCLVLVQSLVNLDSLLGSVHLVDSGFGPESKDEANFVQGLVKLSATLLVQHCHEEALTPSEDWSSSGDEFEVGSVMILPISFWVECHPGYLQWRNRRGCIGSEG